MKKFLTSICALIIGFVSFAQKNEIKAAEKALKKNDYTTAKANIKAAEALIGNMDDKMKDHFYYLKAQSLFMNGAISNDNIDPAIEAVNNLENLKAQTGKSKYYNDALEIKKKIFGTVAGRAEQAFNAKNYEVAAMDYNRAYAMSKTDTLFLYAAATSYLNAQKYDKSLPLYEKLLEMGYEGSGTSYTAVNKSTGAEENFGSKDMRDLSVKSGEYIKPMDKKLPSKKGDVLRYMSLIYSLEGNTDKALELISEAKKYNPDDMQLIIAEAKAYFAKGDKEKMLSLLEEAKSKAKNDAVSLYNLGYYAMEAKEYDMALDYFKNSIEADPKFADAYLNIANIITSEDEKIVEEMNSLGTSEADNKRYDELREEKIQVLKKAIPYLEKSFELNPRVDTGKFLLSVYNGAFETEKAKELKQKIADMESGN